jgi:hypothetical protein
MRTRLVVFGLGALLALFMPAGIAMAAATPAPVPTQLVARADVTTVSGRPVAIHVVLRDAGGDPVAGATIRLLATTTFLGSDREEVVDEAVTDATGRALLAFSPAEAGAATVIVRSEADADHAAAETSIAFLVQRPVVAYHATPTGLQVPWARSSLILVPVAGIWITYLAVFGQIRRIRRLGVRATQSTD